MTDQPPENDGPPLRPANENPWYVMMTLHGEQQEGPPSSTINAERAVKNRRTWNRWIARSLDDEARKELLASGCVPKGDLKPFSDDEYQELQECYKRRWLSLHRKGYQSYKNIFDMDFDIEGVTIIFEETEINHPLNLSSFIFPNIQFSRSIFRSQVNFDYASFFCGSFFANTIFQNAVSFKKTTFNRNATFVNADFKHAVHFDSANFCDSADFRNADFHGEARFVAAKFRQSTRFEIAKFNGSADFRRACFCYFSDFAAASFKSSAVFQSASFGGDSHFDRAAIQGRADFSRIEFKCIAQFAETDFQHDADFRFTCFRHKAEFVRAKFGRAVHFDHTRFAKAPQFQDVDLPFDSSWRAVVWPAPPARSKDDEQRKDAWREEDAYAVLRHAMNKAQRPAAELDFFVLELRARQATEPNPLRRLITAAYLGLGDGGRSAGRPFVAWVGVLGVMFLAHYLALAPGLASLAEPAWGQEWAARAFRRALDGALVVGAPLKDQPRLWADHPPGFGLQVLSLLHAGFSALCLFLAALGLRNWLRLKS